MNTSEDGNTYFGNGLGARRRDDVGRAFAGPSQADFDALADLFLNPGRDEDTDTRCPQKPGRRGAVRVEGLVVGHLPVLAGAWIGQYLRQSAANFRERVGLVRCTRDHVFVDVAGDGPASSGGSRELSEAIRGAGADRWILVAPPTDEIDLAKMAAEGGLDALTVLTGADEAAVVACYSTIKTLSDRTGIASSAVGVGVALVGADTRRAQEIGERLERATGQFLGRPARIATTIDRVSGGGTVRLYGGGDPLPPREVLRLLREKQMNAADLPRQEVKLEKPTTIGRSTLQEETVVVRPTATEPVSRHSDSALPETEVHPAASGRLADHVHGLRPVSVACPYADDVEFALDAAGSLHVLALDERGTGLSHLLCAIAWARAHAGLIAAAHAGVVCALPVGHLFVTSAPAAKHLLFADVRVHLLTHARSRDSVVEVCVDLN